MTITEGLCKLMFELSNEDRLNILLELQERAARLTQLAEKVGITVQETSRHLSRLSDAKLIWRDSDGSYRSTPYGQHAMRLLPGFDFLLKHREYLATHTIMNIPDEFLSRIGELRDCTFTDDVMEAFRFAEVVIQDAHEHIWILSDQILMSALPFLEEALKRGVRFSLILQKDTTPPPGFKPIPLDTDLIERRILERVNATMTISEKKARVAFPTTDGKMDYIGFGSTDEDSHGWCKDLFSYYWKRALPGRPKGYPPPL